MKKIRIICIGLILLIGLCGFVDHDAPHGSGIQFFKGSFKEALAQSKIQKKPVFVDVYAKWCGPCKKLKKRTFKDEEVGNYFNKNFINVTVDGETAEGAQLLERYAIRSYPTLLIVDNQGNVKTRASGYMEPYILINFGRRIIP